MDATIESSAPILKDGYVHDNDASDSELEKESKLA